MDGLFDAPLFGGTRHWKTSEQFITPRLMSIRCLDIFAYGSVLYYMDDGFSLLCMAPCSLQSHKRVPWYVSRDLGGFLARDCFIIDQIAFQAMDDNVFGEQSDTSCVRR